MSNGFSSLIQADLASLTNAAHSLSNSAGTIAAASQFGAQHAQGAPSFAQSMR